MTIHQDKNRKANRLINEKSPYLQQHAYNPVDWYPWCDEAFAKAKAENKPILLSSGYSTCHWCHVMAHESFENEDVARVLNQHFISIKVDREERPEVDNIYMSFCQIMTGGGGWPLTIFMTPNQQPFYAGTYFPLKATDHYLGFIDLLIKIYDLWVNNQQHLIDRSDEFVYELKRKIPKRKEANIPNSITDESINLFSKSFDFMHGGFSVAPKFPMPHALLFLLNYSILNNKSGIDMVIKTLESMYKGGIYDHIGGGFARYSTDQKWLVPHFEKMLYDNALLIPLYAQMSTVLKNPTYSEVANEVIDYLLRDMQAPEGAFYTAEDADSEGIEGQFYVFTPKDLLENLPETEALLFCKQFDITTEGNFEGRSIPNLLKSNTIDSKSDHGQLINELKIKVRRIRDKRIRPHRDEKILSGWNGLVIAALAKAGRLLNRPDYYTKAEKCYSFIKKNMCDDQGRLYGSYCDTTLGSLAVLDDYAFLINGLLELFFATGKAYLLEDARHFTENVFMLFGDDDEGGFYFYGNDSEQLIIRPKESYDGATPSGNAIMVENLLKLNNIKREPYYRDNAIKSLKAFTTDILRNPLSHSAWLNDIMFYNKKPIYVVIASMSVVDAAPLEQVVDTNYYPYLTVIKYRGDKDLLKELSFLENYVVSAKATAYVCTDDKCYEPITDAAVLKQLLDRIYDGGNIVGQ